VPQFTELPLSDPWPFLQGHPEAMKIGSPPEGACRYRIVAQGNCDVDGSGR
jgi:hypothetical protein